MTLHVMVVAIVLLCSPINGQTCTQKGNCACVMSDGSGTIDISSLGNTDGTPRFPFSKPSSSLPWEFAFNPCYDFSDEHCKNVVSCQSSADDPDANFPLGTAASAVWGTDGKTVTYQSVYSGVTRKSRLTLECDPTAYTPGYISHGEDGAESALYDYTLTSICACAGGCKSGGGGGGGLSVGSILCILFVVCVVVYLVAGGVYMKFARGAQGKEIIPNSSFWLDFHNYVKDGFMFTIGPCTQSGGYSDI